MSLWKPVILIGAALTLGACATIPKPLAGTYTTLPPSSAQQGAANGQQVRWGGEIIETVPEQQTTCFYMLSMPLNEEARPQHGASSQGRFVACKSGFYDPEVFRKGREVTFTGTLDGTMTRKVGDYSYPYPKLDANVVYLWPKYRPHNYGYYGGYDYPYSPFGGFYDPFWGPYYGPYGYYPSGGVIFIQRSHTHDGDRHSHRK